MGEPFGVSWEVTDEDELIAAIGSAGDGDVVLVMNDIILQKRLYIWDKDITIKGNVDGLKIIRGDNFQTAWDPARGSFNPGMIEVASGMPDGSGNVSLTLENITLDDANGSNGVYTNAIPISGGSPAADWASRVYDSVISAYSHNATITLGDGAKVINIGGASAIRVTGGILNLEPGSYVEGSNANPGYFGALWIQGVGTVLNFNTTMDGGPSKDIAINARYIHTDFPIIVNFNGKINNCMINYPIFGSNVGGYELYLSEESEINGNIIKNTNTFVISGNGSKVEFSGKINDNRVDPTTASESSHLILIYGTNDVDIYGEMNGNNLTTSRTGGSHGSSVLMDRSASSITLHADSAISGNTVFLGAIRQYDAPNSVIHIYGEVSGNNSVGYSQGTSTDGNGGGFYMSMGTAMMYDGAKVNDNITYGSGGGFFLNQGATLIMYGGEINGNRANTDRVSDRNSGYAGGGGVMITASYALTSSFTMYDGEVKNNHSGTVGGGVFLSGRTGLPIPSGHTFMMYGGEMSGNTAAQANGKDLAIGGATNNGYPQSSTATSTTVNGFYVSIGPGAVIGDVSVGVGFYRANMFLGYPISGDYNKGGVYLPDRAPTHLLGNLSGTLESSIRDHVNGVTVPTYTVRNSIWYSTDSTVDMMEIIMTSQMANPNSLEWLVAIQPLDASGNAIAGIEIFVPQRTNQGLKVEIPLSDGADGYAVVLLSTPKVVSMDLYADSSGNGTFHFGVPGSPSYHVTLTSGGSVSVFTIVPDEGWKIGSVILTAGDGTVSNKTAAAQNGTLSVSYNELASGYNEIFVTFVEKPVLLVSVDGGDGEAYIDTPLGPELQKVLETGKSFDVIITPADGWRIYSVTLVRSDGTVADLTEAAQNGTLSVSYNELTGGNNEVIVTFVENPILLVSVGEGDGEAYIDTPLGPELQKVLETGESFDVIITPADGWKIHSVTLVRSDGTAVDLTAAVMDGIITLSYDDLGEGLNVLLITFTVPSVTKGISGAGWIIPILLLATLMILAWLWRHTKITGIITCDGEAVTDAVVIYSLKDENGEPVRRDIPVTTDLEGRYVIFVRKGWSAVLMGAEKEGYRISGAERKKDDIITPERLSLGIEIEDRVTEVNLIMEAI